MIELKDKRWLAFKGQVLGIKGYAYLIGQTHLFKMKDLVQKIKEAISQGKQ